MLFRSGRNRYRACVRLGIEPEIKLWDQVGTPLAFVVSKNLHRLHLDESQRAMVADKIRNVQRGGDRRSEDFKLQNCTLDGNSPISRADAAEIMNVSERSISNAHTVRAKGVPMLVQAVEAGKITVTAAAEIACKTKGEQQEIVTGKALNSSIRPIADKGKGVSRAAKKMENRVEAFEHLVAVVSATCKGAGEQEIPPLALARTEEIHRQLKSAHRDLGKLVRRFSSYAKVRTQAMEP